MLQRHYVHSAQNVDHWLLLVIGFQPQHGKPETRSMYAVDIQSGQDMRGTLCGWVIVFCQREICLGPFKKFRIEVPFKLRDLQVQRATHCNTGINQGQGSPLTIGEEDQILMARLPNTS